MAYTLGFRWLRLNERTNESQKGHSQNTHTLNCTDINSPFHRQAIASVTCPVRLQHISHRILQPHFCSVLFTSAIYTIELIFHSIGNGLGGRCISRHQWLFCSCRCHFGWWWWWCWLLLFCHCCWFSVLSVTEVFSCASIHFIYGNFIVKVFRWHGLLKRKLFMGFHLITKCSQFNPHVCSKQFVCVR